MDSRFSPLALAGFELFFLPWMRRRIRAVLLTGLPPETAPCAPLLLVANHVSWWDGFVLRELHRRLRPRAPLYTLMLRSELERRPFFRSLGGIGIDPSAPASVARALRGLRTRREERPDLVVAFFPQGEIRPSFRRPLGFRRGVELFARRLGPLTVLPVGIHLEPLGASAPTLLASAGAPLTDADGGGDAGELERRVEAELDRILAFLARHGERTPREWPAAHDALPEAAASRAGISAAGEVEA